MATDTIPTPAQGTPDSGELRLTMTDLYELGYCRKGQRTSISAYGLDDVKLRKQGLPISELEGIDDHMVQEAVAYVRRKAARAAKEGA